MAKQQIACGDIQEGVSFNEPVYFDDGENMFLAANHPAKRYHVESLKRWNIPFLLTEGTVQPNDAVPQAEAVVPPQEELPPAEGLEAEAVSMDDIDSVIGEFEYVEF